MWSRCACVWNEMEWVVIWLTPCHESSLSFIFHGHGLCIFFLTCLVSMRHTFFGHASFHFFLTWLLSMWHTFFGYASFHIFFITHIIDIWREWSWLRSFYFMDGWWIMLISSVGILHMIMGVYVILIPKYEKILARVIQFDKNSMK